MILVLEIPDEFVTIIVDEIDVLCEWVCYKYMLLHAQWLVDSDQVWTSSIKHLWAVNAVSISIVVIEYYVNNGLWAA